MSGHHTTVYLDEETRARARAAGLNVSEILRQALRAELDRLPPTLTSRVTHDRKTCHFCVHNDHMAERQQMARTIAADFNVHPDLVQMTPEGALITNEALAEIVMRGVV